MKLLYLYIPDYGILKDAEFNFTSDYTFRYDKDKRTILGGKNPVDKCLSDDFFTINKKGDNKVVEQISAIVGNNGSGKTSIAKYMSLVFQRYRNIEHILIFERNNNEEGDNLIYQTFVNYEYFKSFEEFETFALEFADDCDYLEEYFHQKYTLDGSGGYRFINNDLTFDDSRSLQLRIAMCPIFDELRKPSIMDLLII